MSRRILGPFPDLASLPPMDVLTADPLDIVERMQLVHDVLETAGCRCNGTAGSPPRDPEWGDDISELVSRSSPHEIFETVNEVPNTPVTVSVKLETLRPEIDGNGEICAWMYEES